MFEKIRSQFSPAARPRFDRSVAATAGLMFGFAVCAMLLSAAGLGVFALTPAALTLYAAVLPLSVIGGMHAFLDNPPKLPVLAALWYLALFVPMLFFGEVLFGGVGVLSLGGLSIWLPKLIGFRVITMATLSGVLFGAVNAQGALSRELSGHDSDSRPNVDWERRHQEAVRRLATVDVELKQRRQNDAAALRAFDARLARESTALNVDDSASTAVAEEQETEEVEFDLERWRATVAA